MQHHAVTSSRIASVGYDQRTRTLEICFHDKSVYQYQGVPERIFSVFLTVVSKGRFYDGVVKGKYPERKVA
ncbi:KTSC domain-containing protein [Kosakonia sacchari]|uniref:KTSC domain-containing protein n=1 Tax=Kosakonia sacchari TaxID=1158459 RepID=A0A1G4XQG1_9ENTR|nr:KTSC domain-containing protein [Kosakonia sacchari]AHJ73800.1 KTSC domain-containing protein [Kosakonia sacchari SP1]ANR77294.1 KTSC domain-containing protein [Kosakonia sacchari]MDN2486707.1 KTSC domain-containing protein [Kosakonia sacchari]SCX43355.1 KTSC domain-containing protein [Kosakonia sacchari]